jgi:sulfur relay (sulfurtransferase) complex TusBCD TusD component (DsrE family)
VIDIEFLKQGEKVDSQTVLLFTRNGMGHGPEALQKTLASKFLGLLMQSGELPAKILFYTDGVKLACKGSDVIGVLKDMKENGVELILCKTCLDSYGLTDTVEVGIVGGMPDIIEAMQKADKVISL